MESFWFENDVQSLFSTEKPAVHQDLFIWRYSFGLKRIPEI
jgi:hypothetical protein